MVSSQQVAWMQGHEKGVELPTFADALKNLDDWLNDTALNSMSVEERERRMVWGLSLNG